MEIVFINVIGTLLFLFESLYVNTAIFDLKTLCNFSIESRFMYRKAEKAQKVLFKPHPRFIRKDKSRI